MSRTLRASASPAVLQRRAAAGRVGHDRVDPVDLERAAVARAQARGGRGIARVQVQRAAAHLLARDPDLEAVAHQHLDAGRVGGAEQLGHHAAAEEGHAAAPLAARGVHHRRAVRREQRRQHRVRARQSGQRAQQARAAQQALQSPALVGAQQRRRTRAARAAPPPRGAGSGARARGATRPRAPRRSTSARARLDQVAVAHAGRACGLARAARQAVVHLAGEALVELEPSLGDSRASGRSGRAASSSRGRSPGRWGSAAGTGRSARSRASPRSRSARPGPDARSRVMRAPRSARARGVRPGRSAA